MHNNSDGTIGAAEFHDGELLPMDAIAVCPTSIEDLEELVAQLPRDLANELARMAAWRALGMQAPPSATFRI